jgi:hypothetical protein
MNDKSLKKSLSLTTFLTSINTKTSIYKKIDLENTIYKVHYYSIIIKIV